MTVSDKEVGSFFPFSEKGVGSFFPFSEKGVGSFFLFFRQSYSPQEGVSKMEIV